MNRKLGRAVAVGIAVEHAPLQLQLARLVKRGAAGDQLRESIVARVTSIRINPRQVNFVDQMLGGDATIRLKNCDGIP